MAKALRDASQNLRDGSPQARAFAQIADGLADAADAVRNRDVNELAGDLTGFARRNPLAFLGGAALLGFAATRFAKASSTPRPQADDSYGSTVPSNPGSPVAPDNYGAARGPAATGTPGYGGTPSTGDLK